MQIKSHKDLEIWKRSMELVVKIYKITKPFPSSENFGLISQMRRAAVSIPSNIAEGAARKSTKEFIQYLYIALGSLSELDTQCELSQKLEYLKKEKDILIEIKSIRIMICRLIEVLKKKI